MPRVPFDPATDYYQLLGVRPGASAEEIQTAYRRLAKEYHPDLNAGSSTAAARMARVNVAKSVLLDRATRASYDQLRGVYAQVPPPYVAYAGAAVGRPRYRVVRTTRTGAMQRGGSLDRQTGILLLVVVPLLAALLVYVFQAMQLGMQPQRALPSDLVLVPSGRPTAHNTAESAFSMLHEQAPSRELAASVNNLIGSSYDGTPVSQELVADGRRLVRSAAAGDTEAWDAAVNDVCRLAGHC